MSDLSLSSYLRYLDWSLLWFELRAGGERLVVSARENSNPCARWPAYAMETEASMDSGSLIEWTARHGSASDFETATEEELLPYNLDFH